MSMHDHHNSMRAEVCIPPVAAGTTGTGQTGRVIDISNYAGVEFVFGYGAITATAATFTPVVLEGDATGAMTAVADADLIGTEEAAGVAAAVRVDYSTEKVTKRLGYKGNKRYVQAQIINTATAAVPVHCDVLLFNPRQSPVA